MIKDQCTVWELEVGTGANGNYKWGAVQRLGAGSMAITAQQGYSIRNGEVEGP